MRRGRRMQGILLALGMLLATLPTPRPAAAAPQEQQACPYGPPVVVDAGHGGVDGGTNREDVLEKDITLAVAKRMVATLQARKVPVAMTRDSDVDLGGVMGRGRHQRDLSSRIERVRQCGGGMLISLHVNAAKRPDRTGYVLFYQQRQPLSRDLAGLVDAQFAAGGLKRAEPVLTGDFYVLRRSPVPAVLVEMGFLTNPQERSMLQEPGYQQRLADMLANSCILAHGAWFPVLPSGRKYSFPRLPIY